MQCFKQTAAPVPCMIKPLALCFIQHDCQGRMMTWMTSLSAYARQPFKNIEAQKDAMSCALAAYNDASNRVLP